MTNEITPKTIKEHRYNWIFEPEWQMTHNRMDGNSFTFFIGANGTGKTYASLERSSIMGVDEDGDHSFLFDWDHLEKHVFWDKNKMLNRIHELENFYSAKEIRGYQIILDEAQKSANAKEWNDREVLEFSKEMTTIRSSRLNISMTMPTYRMITTDLRQLGTYMVEMLPASRIDLVNDLSYCKLHLLELKPFLGDVWRRRPFMKARHINPVTGLPTIHMGLLSEFRWELPNKTIRHNYERLKKQFREESAAARAVIVEEKKKRLTLREILEIVRKDVGRFKNKLGKVDGGLIQAEDLCGDNLSDKAARIINAELGF